MRSPRLRSCVTVLQTQARRAQSRLLQAPSELGESGVAEAEPLPGAGSRDKGPTPTSRRSSTLPGRVRLQGDGLEASSGAADQIRPERSELLQLAGIASRSADCSGARIVYDKTSGKRIRSVRLDCPVQVIADLQPHEPAVTGVGVCARALQDQALCGTRQEIDLRLTEAENEAGSEPQADGILRSGRLALARSCRPTMALPCPPSKSQRANAHRPQPGSVRSGFCELSFAPAPWSKKSPTTRCASLTASGASPRLSNW